MDKERHELLISEVMNTDFSSVEQRFSNLGWKEYMNLDGGEKLSLIAWLTKKELQGELTLRGYIENIESNERKYTISLSRGEETRYFKRCKEAGEFLGVSALKICRNKNRDVLGWRVTECNVVEVYNPFSKEIRERRDLDTDKVIE